MTLIKHKLGFAKGVMWEWKERGEVTYREAGTRKPLFTAQIADVHAVTAAAIPEARQYSRIAIIGDGVELASFKAPGGTEVIVGEWFRGRPDCPMGKPATAAPVAQRSASATSLADELSKLAGLRDDGVLTDAEFADQKAKLLAR